MASHGNAAAVVADVLSRMPTWVRELHIAHTQLSMREAAVKLAEAVVADAGEVEAVRAEAQCAIDAAQRGKDVETTRATAAEALTQQLRLEATELRANIAELTATLAHSAHTKGAFEKQVAALTAQTQALEGQVSSRCQPIMACKAFEFRHVHFRRFLPAVFCHALRYAALSVCPPVIAALHTSFLLCPASSLLPVLYACQLDCRFVV